MRRLLVAASCALLLTGCGGGLTPQGTLQDQTAEVIDAANAKSVAGLRSAVATLRSTIQKQLSKGQLSQAKADTLRSLLAKIEQNAELLTEPSPTPSPTSSPTPVATTPPPTTPPPTTPPPTTPPPTTAPPTTAPPTEQPTTPPPSIGIGLGEPSPSAT